MLIEFHDGRQPVYLVTNLPKSKLSDGQAIRIDQLRWGIELFFRTFKQTFGRRKLRSHSAPYAELELDWALLALWGMLLLGQMQLQENSSTSARQSPVKTIRAFQSTITDYRIRPATEEYSLWLGLRTAVLDDYKRNSNKASHNDPRKKQRERTGPPKIETATKEQQLAVQQLKEKEREIRLAA